jgi:phosphoglycerol transferase
MAASNVLQPIDSLVGMEVERFHQAPGTNWSIAGMISSQCGIPVKAFYGNKANKYASKEFLPHAVCMSDVLYEYGYHQIFMVGPDLKFAGMDKFYSSHKFQEMYGRDELRDKVDTKVPFNGYGGGPNDDVLFDAAYSVAEAQAKQGKPFNLTIITTDNHFPQGFPSLNCTESERRSGFLGTYKCTSKMVRNFVENINANSLFQNTDIVIMGDHLFMANEDQQKLFPTTRSIYFKYISKSNLPGFKRSEMTHFDVAPTILEALGFVSQDKSAFGLGYSLFDDSITNSYIPSRLDDGILNRSKVYDGFWGIR